MKCCCFTGHRYLSEWDIGAMRAELERAIDRATSEGYYHFIAGNAVGVDTMAAQIVLQKKENDPRITLEIAIPFEGHNAHIEEIAEMQKKADFAHVVSNVKSRCKAFVERDRYMVAKSDRVIAVVHIKRNEIKMGGTKRTVDYAKSEGKEIELIGLMPKLIRRSHEHIHQKYVPYSELMEIMRDMYCQDNLIYCLTFGKNAPRYNEKLMLVAQKLELVSSLFYLCDGVPKKLPREMYERFFDDYVESESEACERLVRLGGDCRSAPLVYEKYGQIKAALLPLLCDTDEVWVADEMRDVVEYILDHDTVPNGFDAKQCFKDRDLDYGNFYN